MVYIAFCDQSASLSIYQFNVLRKCLFQRKFAQRVYGFCPQRIFPAAPVLALRVRAFAANLLLYLERRAAYQPQTAHGRSSDYDQGCNRNAAFKMFFLPQESIAIFTVSSVQTDPLKARFWGYAAFSLPHAASLNEDVIM